MFLVFAFLVFALTFGAMYFLRQQKKEVPKFVKPAGIGVSLLLVGFWFFHNVFFYAEPGNVYHARDVLGTERVIDSVGYQYNPFGRVNVWKKAMSVQAEGGSIVALGAEEEGSSASASIPAMRIMFLDQVDAQAEATVRFRLPPDRQAFLDMVHEYRTPDNLLRTSLIPAFKETLQATASLMSAEEYYSGSRTEFNNEFENQMQNGVYIVKRTEEVVDNVSGPAKGSANASKGQNQDDYDDATKVVFRVVKQFDDNGIIRRKTQKFTNFGVSVIDARITDMNPNKAFLKRMELKQKASADRAIAREQRVQEEEQRLLAITKGEREVAERQAQAKVKQIELTTNAETDKQLAITRAMQQKEQALIEKETAQIQLEQSKIDAARIKELANAEAYKKKAVLQADNALAQKLDAEMAIQKYWADAFAARKVPSQVITSGGDGSAPTGSDGEARTLMQLLTLDTAKRLSYDRDLNK